MCPALCRAGVLEPRVCRDLASTTGGARRHLLEKQAQVVFDLDSAYDEDGLHSRYKLNLQYPSLGFHSEVKLNHLDGFANLDSLGLWN